MYASLKNWINVPYQYKPFIRYNGAGVKQFDSIVDSMCYPVGDVKLVTDTAGVEKTSTTQLYVPGTESISANDVVIFGGEERAIYRVTSYYRNGVVDLKVVYL